MAAAKKTCLVCSKELDAEESVCAYCKTPCAPPTSDNPGDALFEPSRTGFPPPEDDGKDAELARKLAKRKLKAMLFLIIGGLALVFAVFAPKEMTWLAGQGSKWVVGKWSEIREAAGVKRDPVPSAPKPKPPVPVKPPEPESTLATGKSIPAGKGRWTIQGRVFDVPTLNPVPKAKLFFKDGTSKELFHTMTNSKGFYRALLQERATGFELEIKHPDYFVKYVEDWLPSIRVFGRERREEIARDIDSQPDKPEVFLGTDGQVLEKDLALVLRKRLKPKPVAPPAQ